jgi:uncharacterized membrane protein YbhN (UPF0104 family)
MKKPLKSHAELAGLVLLAAVTVYGVHEFATGDWRGALAYWREQVWVLPAVLALALLDFLFEAAAALRIYGRFGVHALDRQGLAASLAMRAGLLLPAQLSRLIRPDALVRQKGVSAIAAMKAEGAAFLLDALSVVALVTGLITWRFLPWAAPFAAAAVVGGALCAAHLCSGWLVGTRFEMPEGFWLERTTLGAVCLEGCAWLAHGAAFALLVQGLTAEISFGDAVAIASVASVLGAGSGAPAGVGVTDGLLGASLGFLSVPPEQLAIAVGGFRLATCFAWIPVGWWGLALTTRRADSAPTAQPEPVGLRAAVEAPEAPSAL